MCNIYTRITDRDLFSTGNVLFLRFTYLFAYRRASLFGVARGMSIFMTFYCWLFSRAITNLGQFSSSNRSRSRVTAMLRVNRVICGHLSRSQFSRRHKKRLHFALIAGKIFTVAIDRFFIINARINEAFYPGNSREIYFEGPIGRPIGHGEFRKAGNRHSFRSDLIISETQVVVCNCASFERRQVEGLTMTQWVKS